MPRNTDGFAGTGGSVWVRFQVSDESWIPESRMTVGAPVPAQRRNSFRPSPIATWRPAGSFGAGSAGDRHGHGERGEPRDVAHPRFLPGHPRWVMPSRANRRTVSLLPGSYI